MLYSFTRLNPLIGSQNYTDTLPCPFFLSSYSIRPVVSLEGIEQPYRFLQIHLVNICPELIYIAFDDLI